MAAGGGPSVLACLEAALSDDHNAREQGQLWLNQMISSDLGLSVALAQVLADTAVPLPLRQMAAVLLRQYAAAHWCRHVEDFVEPEPSPQVKAAVRQYLLQALADPLSKIRSLAAYAVSVVAGFDWPEDWPDLFDHLLAGLHSREPNIVHGIMRVLVDFINEVDNAQLPVIVPLCLPELYRITLESQTWDLRTRGRAMSVFSSLLIAARELGEEGDTAVFSSLKEHIPQWIQILAAICAAPDGPDVDLGLRADAVGAAADLLQCLGASLKGEVLRLMGPIYGLLVSSLDRYLAAVVNGIDDGEGAAVDEEGNLLGYELLLTRCFDFIEVLLDKNLQLKAMKQNLPQLFSLIIAYMQMSEDQAELWLNDSDQFVMDDSEVSLSGSLRNTAENLLDVLADAFTGTVVAKAVIQAAMEQLDLAQQRRALADGYWWKVAEAALATLGRPEISAVLLAAIGSGKITFDLPEFLTSTVAMLAQVTDQPFVAGRALLLAGRCAQAVPPEVIESFLALAVAGLRQGQPVPIQVGSLKALSDFAHNLHQSNPERIAPYAGPIIEGTLPMIGYVTPEVLRELVDMLTPTVQVSPEATVAHGSELISLALAVFLRSFQNVAMAEAVLDLFDALASIPQLEPLFAQKALPTLASIFARHEDPALLGLVQMAADIVGVMAKRASPQFGQTLVDALLGPLSSAMLASADGDLLQYGAEALRMFLSKHFSATLSFQQAGMSGLERIVRVVEHILSPEMSDSAAAFIGRLVTSLILHAQDHLGPYTETLLVAVLRKLQTSVALTVAESLVLAFCRLINIDAELVINFLVKHQAVEFLMKKWCTDATAFAGAYNIKVSAMAMANILVSNDPRLEFNVEGDPVHEKGIRTRSKTRADGGPRHMMVPLRFRCLQLLLREWEAQLQRQDAAGAAGEGDEDVDGDEGDLSYEDFDTGGADIENPFAPAEDYFHASDMIDLGFGGEMDEHDDDDPDVLADPLHGVDLKTEILKAIKAFAQQPVSREYMSALPAHDQHLMQEALSAA